MGKLHHSLWIVEITNKIFGPLVLAVLQPLGFAFADPAKPIPDHIVMCAVIVLLFVALGLFLRSRLSVEHPGKLQIVLEDLVTAVLDLMKANIGPGAAKYFPLVGTIGIFIFTANMIGKIPGFMSPTASISTTLGCALTVWVYYHWQGIRTQGFGQVPGPLRGPAGRPDLPRADHAADRVDQPSVPGAVALAASLRQHLRRGDGGADHREHHPVPRAAADGRAGRHHGHPAGVHLHAADDHLPGRRGAHRAPRGARAPRGGAGRRRTRTPRRSARAGPAGPARRSVGLIVDSFVEEALVVRKLVLTLALVAVGAVLPAYAQEAAGAANVMNTELVKWSIITGGFALAIAAAFGALGQSKGLAAAAEGIARNPAAAGEIRGALILGLVLIESLVIYVLLISLILFFVKPFGG